MRWIIRVHDEEARGIFHLGGLHGGGDAGSGGPEEGGGGTMLFDLRPEGGFEGGIFGALFLDYVGVGNGGGEVGVELEGAGREEVGDEVFFD